MIALTELEKTRSNTPTVIARSAIETITTKVDSNNSLLFGQVHFLPSSIVCP